MTVNDDWLSNKAEEWSAAPDPTLEPKIGQLKPRKGAERGGVGGEG